MTLMDDKLADAWEKRQAEGNLAPNEYSVVIGEVLADFARTMDPEYFDNMLLQSNLTGALSVGEAYQVHTRILIRLLDAAGKL